MYQKAMFNNRGTKTRANKAEFRSNKPIEAQAHGLWAWRGLGFRVKKGSKALPHTNLFTYNMVEPLTAKVEVKPAKTLAPITAKADPSMAELKTVLMAILAKM